MGVHQEHLAAREHQPVHAGVGQDALATADHLVDVLQVHGGIAPGADDHPVNFVLVQQHRADQRQPAPHFDLRHLDGDALALGDSVIGLPEVAIAVVMLDVDDVVVDALFQSQSELLDALGDDCRAPDEGRPGQAFVHHDLRRPQHAFFFALAIGDALFLR